MDEPHDSPEPIGALASLAPQVRPVRLRGEWATRLVLLVVSLPCALTILSLGVTAGLEEDQFIHGVVTRVLQHKNIGTCEAVVRYTIADPVPPDHEAQPEAQPEAAPEGRVASSAVVVEAVSCDALPAVGDARTVQVVRRVGRTMARQRNVVGEVIVACFVAGAAVVFVVDLWLLRSVTVLTLRARRLARCGVEARAGLVGANGFFGVTRAVYRYDVAGHDVDTVAWSMTRPALLPRDVDVLYDALFVDQCMLASEALVRRKAPLTPTPTMKPEVLQ